MTYPACFNQHCPNFGVRLDKADQETFGTYENLGGEHVHVEMRRYQYHSAKSPHKGTFYICFNCHTAIGMVDDDGLKYGPLPKQVVTYSDGGTYFSHLTEDNKEQPSGEPPSMYLACISKHATAQVERFSGYITAQNSIVTPKYIMVRGWAKEEAEAMRDKILTFLQQEQ